MFASCGPSSHSAHYDPPCEHGHPCFPTQAQPKTLPVAMPSGVGPHPPFLPSPTLSGRLTAGFGLFCGLFLTGTLGSWGKGTQFGNSWSFAFSGHLGAPAGAVWSRLQKPALQRAQGQNPGARALQEALRRNGGEWLMAQAL